jgi:hypothetical protein
MSTLYGVPEPDQPAPPSDVTVAEPTDPGTFVDLWLTGAPEAERERLRPIATAELGGWRRYVAGQADVHRGGRRARRETQRGTPSSSAS